MSDMVERLSRAFADHEGWDWGKLDQLEDTSFGWGRNHIRQHIYENIRGMREPTEAMLEASNREWDGRMSARSAGVWQAMIDAALVSERGAEE